jgi:hypothetical protein
LLRSYNRRTNLITTVTPQQLDSCTNLLTTITPKQPDVCTNLLTTVAPQQPKDCFIEPIEGDLAQQNSQKASVDALIC